MVFEKVKAMLAERLGMSAEEIKEDSKFADLGLDSLDTAEMLMDVQSEFGVEVEADPSLNTVGALVAKLESLVSKS